MVDNISVNAIAEEVARALSFARTSNEGAMVVTPLLYPGGARAVVRINETAEGFFVSDGGGAKREADLMGGRGLFTRIARATAARFAVRFDSDLIFDLEVPREALVTAAIAVANASKTAVEQTAERLSERHANSQRERLSERLTAAFPAADISYDARVKGASAQWTFDAVLKDHDRTVAFDIVLPHANAVHAAVSKFLDLRDLGEDAPARIAVVTDEKATPLIPLLGRTARIINIASAPKAFRAAA
ncbi:hypothetical protein [Mesorhizobium sp.]|uniref:hypothetical protein n=1 Tax=Mesorhizobium sp. TaxID=1871066 RepID=UPI000FE73D04|nr:hypothetical protein [Mesorhizobium sp.]RWM26878.1 MAG: hypothetical protein EOR74_13810 [Mesorhizobium sp.]RWM36249.1 MAG: hypothetical protein EOR75_22420 [Mesorhizobium sp.]TJV50162.1 MAG: hypothetical protein E5Y01_20455 [Mesorhizobium sp.]